MSRLVPLVALLAVAACQPVAPADAPPSVPAPETVAPRPPSVADRLAGRVWIDTNPDAALGSLVAFLQDGTLVMDSCVETYRLSTWRADPNGDLVWTEGTAEVRAHVQSLTADALRLTLLVGADSVEATYRAADVPFVCPDLPR